MKKRSLAFTLIFAALMLLIARRAPTAVRPSNFVAAANVPAFNSRSTVPLGPESSRITPAVANQTSPADLVDRTLDLRANDQDRWDAVFALTERRPMDVTAVGRVAAAPYAIESSKASFEIRVRLHALQALDHAALDGAQVIDQLTQIATTNADENLRQYAVIALMGIEQNRPGKLIRFFDLILAEGKK